MKTLPTKKQYESYKERNEELLGIICHIENDDDIPQEIKDEFHKISRLMIDYEKAYHPLPWRVSTLITDEIKIQMQKHHLKQRTLGQKLGLSESRMSDLLRGKRPLSVPILKKLHTELNIPADFLLTHC